MVLTPPESKLNVEASERALEHDLLRDYATQIGLLVYAWNKMQSSLMMLLERLLFRNNERDSGYSDLFTSDLTSAYWHSLKNDSAQRDIVRSVTRVSLSNEPFVRDEILWALGEIDNLARARNDAIHVAVDVYGALFGGEFIAVNNYLGPPRANRLKGKRLDELFRQTALHALSLDNFINCFAVFIEPLDQRRPWPERPCRPSVLQDHLQPEGNSTRSDKEHQSPPQSA